MLVEVLHDDREAAAGRVSRDFFVAMFLTQFFPLMPINF